MKQSEGAPAIPLQPAFKFDLAAAKPTIGAYGNTIREANQNDFTILAGNAVAFSRLTCNPARFESRTGARTHGSSIIACKGKPDLDHWTGQQ